MEGAIFPRMGGGGEWGGSGVGRAGCFENGCPLLVPRVLDWAHSAAAPAVYRGPEKISFFISVNHQ